MRTVAYVWLGVVCEPQFVSSCANIWSPGVNISSNIYRMRQTKCAGYEANVRKVPTGTLRAGSSERDDCSSSDSSTSDNEVNYNVYIIIS